MRKTTEILKKETITESITCDKCGKEVDYKNLEFQEYQSIIITGGYGSIFGDGLIWKCDLCQHCIQIVLGSYLKYGGKNYC